jgi:hypothetical protein
MRPIASIRSLAAIAVGFVALAGCSSDTVTNVAGPDPNRVFVQIERIGNPLVSEVFLEKRDHGFHNSGAPSTDVAQFKTKLEAFVKNVAGRSTTVQQTLSAVLLPDMLIVQTDKAPTTAGWLTWALANGYGGRKLSEDVVDAGTAALFGNLLDNNNQTPALSGQHLPRNDKPFLTVFPYVPEPTR